MAFTLVEIIVVLAIIAIGTSVALFGYGNYRKNMTVEMSAARVQRILQLAKNRAIESQLPHKVVIDFKKNTLWIDGFDAILTYPPDNPKVVPQTAMTDFVVIESVNIGGALLDVTSPSNDASYPIDPLDPDRHFQTILFQPDGSNPYIVFHLKKEFDDPISTNYYSVRMYPSSGEAQVVAKDFL